MCSARGVDTLVYALVMDEAIEAELVAAQAAVDSARQARIRRQEAALKARDAGWSKYRIAQVLGVKGPTVDSILETAEKKSADTSNPAPAHETKVN